MENGSSVINEFPNLLIMLSGCTSGKSASGMLLLGFEHRFCNPREEFSNSSCVFPGDVQGRYIALRCAPDHLLTSLSTLH